MNGHSRRDRKSGDARVAGPSRSPLLMLPIRLRFSGQEKNQELLLPSASDCAWAGAIAKDQRGRLDDERLAGFNQSADLSTHRRKNSVRTTRATAPHRRNIDPVELANVALDVPGAHPAGVQSDDLVVEPGEAATVFADQRRIEPAVPVARNRQLERALGRENRLGAAAVAV